MSRLNLKELRNLLNQVDDDILENISFSSDLMTEEPNGNFTIAHTTEVDNEQDILDFYQTKTFEDIKKGLLEYFDNDALMIIRYKMDDDSVLEVVGVDW